MTVNSRPARREGSRGITGFLPWLMRNLQTLTSKDNALCANLWTVSVNSLVSGCPCCGRPGLWKCE